MPEYRVYFIDRANRICRPSEIVECADDQEATEKAQQLVDGNDVELWSGSRFIKRFAGVPGE